MNAEPSSGILRQITCPHCWQKSRPHEIKWISAHPTLRDDTKVPDGLRRFLPTRFDITGQAIDAGGELCTDVACPRCHLGIPRDLIELPVSFYSIMGSPGSGKSYFLASSTWQLRTTLAQRFALSFEDSDPVANNKLNNYEETLFLNSRRDTLVALPKTELDGDLYEQVEVEPGRIMLLPRPFCFRMRLLPAHVQAGVEKRPGRAMCLYDNAGEHFLPGAQTANAPGTRHLAVAKALFFIFDPTQHARVRAALVGRTLDPQVQDDLVSYRQDHILSEATRRIRAELGLRQDQRDRRPLIVVLTKYDAWRALAGSRSLTPEMIYNTTRGPEGSESSTLNLSFLKTVSSRFRQLLMKLAPEVVATAEAFSEDVTFIPVSALGCSPEEIPGVPRTGDPPRAALGIRPESIAPEWSEVPLLYALHRTMPGLIPITPQSTADAPVATLFTPTQPGSPAEQGDTE